MEVSGMVTPHLGLSKMQEDVCRTALIMHMDSDRWPVKSRIVYDAADLGKHSRCRRAKILGMKLLRCSGNIK